MVCAENFRERNQVNAFIRPRVGALTNDFGNAHSLTAAFAAAHAGGVDPGESGDDVFYFVVLPATMMLAVACYAILCWVGAADSGIVAVSVALIGAWMATVTRRSSGRS